MNRIVSLIKRTYPTKKLIVIGYNINWKTKVNMGHKNNRIFYQIPYKKLINKLEYALRGHTNVVLTNESYTSKCDALAKEKVMKHDVYKGRRDKRGLFH